MTDELCVCCHILTDKTETEHSYTCLSEESGLFVAESPKYYLMQLDSEVFVGGLY